MLAVAAGESECQFTIVVKRVQVLLSAGGHDIVDGPGQRSGNILGKQGNAEPGAYDHRSRVRWDIPVQHPEEGGFPRSIATDQTDSLTLLDGERGVVQKTGPAQTYAHIV